MQTLKMLIELAKQKDPRIKYNTRMTKKTLCERLGIELLPPPPKATKVTFTNTATGEVLKYVSIYRASKELKVNPGLIVHYNCREISIRGQKWKVLRL